MRDNDIIIPVLRIQSILRVHYCHCSGDKALDDSAHKRGLQWILGGKYSGDKVRRLKQYEAWPSLTYIIASVFIPVVSLNDLMNYQTTLIDPGGTD